MIRIEMKNKYMMNYMIENLLKTFNKLSNMNLFVINKRTKDFKVSTPEIYVELKEGKEIEILKLNLRLSLDFGDLCKTKVLNKTERKQIKRFFPKRKASNGN